MMRNRLTSSVSLIGFALAALSVGEVISESIKPNMRMAPISADSHEEDRPHFLLVSQWT